MHVLSDCKKTPINCLILSTTAFPHAKKYKHSAITVGMLNHVKQLNHPKCQRYARSAAFFEAAIDQGTNMGPRAAQLLEDSVKSAAWAACDFDEPWEKNILKIGETQGYLGGNNRNHT